MTVQRLSETYGSIDLLAAYLMRERNLTEEEAIDQAYATDLWLSEVREETEDVDSY